MKPGRDLDILIAEKVMGYSVGGPHEGVFTMYKQKQNAPTGQYDSWHGELPNYSEDMIAAWQVVEKINRWHFSIARHGMTFDPSGWIYEAKFVGVIKDSTIEAEGETVPHAICLAALKVVGYK